MSQSLVKNLIHLVYSTKSVMNRLCRIKWGCFAL